MENSSDKVEVVKKDSVISISIHEQFYNRLKNALLVKTLSIPKEDLIKITESITKKEPVTNIDHEILLLLTSLVMEFETVAKKEDKIEYKTIDEIKELFKD